MNKVIGKNENMYFMEKKVTDFLANPIVTNEEKELEM